MTATPCSALGSGEGESFGSLPMSPIVVGIPASWRRLVDRGDSGVVHQARVASGLH